MKLSDLAVGETFRFHECTGLNPDFTFTICKPSEIKGPDCVYNYVRNDWKICKTNENLEVIKLNCWSGTGI